MAKLITPKANLSLYVEASTKATVEAQAEREEDSMSAIAERWLLLGRAAERAGMRLSPVGALHTVPARESGTIPSDPGAAPAGGGQ